MKIYANFDDGEIVIVKAENEKQARDKLSDQAAERGWYAGWSNDCRLDEIEFNDLDIWMNF